MSFESKKIAQALKLLNKQSKETNEINLSGKTLLKSYSICWFLQKPHQREKKKVIILQLKFQTQQPFYLRLLCAQIQR